MEDVKRIYLLLSHSNGLKIKELAKALNMDKYYVAEMMFSIDNIPYWYQDNSFLWFAKEGAIEIEEPEEDKLKKQRKRVTGNYLERHVFPETNEGLRGYLKRVFSYPVYSYEETNALFERYRNGDKKARDLIVKGNLKLVAGVARFYRHKGVSYNDLIQEGNLGLLIAIERFDHFSNTSFSNYAKTWIFQAISSSMMSLPYLVRLPISHFILYRKIQKSKDQFVQLNDYQPSVDDIDLGEDIDYEKKYTIFQLPSDLRDLTFVIDDYDSFEDNSNMPDEGLMEESTQIYVQGLLSFLSKREEQILQAYYGLNGITPESFEEISREQGLTRERVRQIHERALRKLKILLGVKKIREEEPLSKERGKKIKLTDNMIEQHGFYHQFRKHSRSSQGIINEAWNSHYESLKQRAQNQVKEEQENKNKLKEIIIRVLRQNIRPMLLGEIFSEVNQKSLGIRYEYNYVKDLLYSMSEVDYKVGGWFMLEKANQFKNRHDTFLQIKTPSYRKENLTYNPSTTLFELVKDHIITKKDCTHCQQKGLRTIGDVNRMIKKHNLTRTSTRFTQYTIDILFKIVDLLGSKKDERTKEKRQNVLTYLMTPNMDAIYKKYTYQIRKIRQASKSGSMIKAKPALLLAIIHGIDEGKITNNRIFLNEWLEIRYTTLMYKYSNNIFDNTEINMPFWHLKNDGFWHLYFGEIEKQITYTPTINWLRKNILYASFDEDLWILLENKEWRMKLRNFIIEHKLSN